jgi:HK97 gp10 family phage protein
MAKIEDNTDKLLSYVDQKIRQGLIQAALLIQRSAKEEVPVDTGTLRRSITHKPHVPTRRVQIGTNVEYAPYVELGTSKMSARPFLRIALEKNRKEIEKIFRAK